MASRRRAICLGLLLIGALGLIFASGVVFWLALGVVAVALVGILLPLADAERFVRVAMVVGSVFAGLALLETALWLWEIAASEPLPEFVAADGAVPLAPDLPPEIRAKIGRMQSALVMPPSWQKRDLADIPGTDPFVWHGVIHQIDANGMRREEPLPPKDPARFRIVVVGDSPRARRTAAGFSCLPAREADEDPHQADPRRPVVDERSAALKRSLGLEPDFYADLLADFEARYRRFGEDVAAMNALVTQSGLPPMVAMVLDQGPRLDGPGRQLALPAERKLRAAGVETVDSEDFYRRYDGTNLAVSRWEGHPNEEAHAIWASELADRIRQHPDLERFATGARIARDQQGVMRRS